MSPFKEYDDATKGDCVCHPDPEEDIFYCERHNCIKTQHYRHLCANRREYFEAYEQSRSSLCLGEGPVTYCVFNLIGDRKWECQECGKKWGGTQPRSDRVCKYNRRNPPQSEDIEGTSEPQPVKRCRGCGPAQADPDNPQMPSLSQRAKNFSKSMGEFAKDVAMSGAEAFLGSEQIAERERICAGCDQQKESWCLSCGCYLPMARTFRSKQCPLKKWPGDT